MLQKTVEVHAGADASVWRPLHHIHCHAIYRGAWDSMVDPNALRDALKLLPGKNPVMKISFYSDINNDVLKKSNRRDFSGFKMS